MSARRPLVRAPSIAPIVKTDAKTPYYKINMNQNDVVVETNRDLLSNIVFGQQKIDSRKNKTGSKGPVAWLHFKS